MWGPVRPFTLVRSEDPSGVSGTGVVADGAVFRDDGRVVVKWRNSANPYPLPFPSIEALLAVHGHGGKTQVHWWHAHSTEIERLRGEVNRLNNALRFANGEVDRLGSQNDRLHAQLRLAPPDNDGPAKVARTLRRVRLWLAILGGRV